MDTVLARGLRTPDLAWDETPRATPPDTPEQVEVGTSEMTEAVLAALDS